MRLYRCRLDMRACHPATAMLATEVHYRKVLTPRPLAFTGGAAIMGRLDELRNSRLQGGQGGLVGLPYKMARSAQLEEPRLQPIFTRSSATLC